MRKVTLPPGCRSLQMQDGRRYVASREGGTVTVSDNHAAAIDRVPGNGVAGLVTAGFRGFVQGGKKNGRWCTNCTPARLWNAWSLSCPRCGSETTPEQSGPVSGTAAPPC